MAPERGFYIFKAKILFVSEMYRNSNIENEVRCRNE